MRRLRFITVSKHQPTKVSLSKFRLYATASSAIGELHSSVDSIEFSGLKAFGEKKEEQSNELVKKEVHFGICYQFIFKKISSKMPK